MSSISSTERFPGKIVVIGAAGQLGQCLRLSCPAAWQDQVVWLDRQQLDLTQPSQIRDLLTALQPKLIINAAAYTQVDLAESQQALAKTINADAVAVVCEVAQALQARVIHVSTDYVFAGLSGQHQTPDAATAPLNYYGYSKKLGEDQVLLLKENGVIIRTAWLYAAHGKNFVNSMLKFMAEREQLSIVVDQVGTPTCADGLAQAIWKVVCYPAISGIHHWTDAGVASWYDFAVAIQEEALTLGLLKTAIPLHAINSQQYPTPAARPACSLLDKSSLIEKIEFAPPHWRVALRQTLKNIVRHQD
jgi:dTDP-4-dehydrorhamnose reductase